MRSRLRQTNFGNKMNLAYLATKLAKFTGFGSYSCCCLWGLFHIICYCGLECSLIRDLFKEFWIVNTLIFGVTMGTLHQWYRY